MASPHHRHQSSLEGVLDFSSPQPPEPDQRNRATDIFNQIVTQYESSQTNDKGYKRITLLRVVHDSVISKDNFLSCFFLFVEKELRQGEDVSELSLSRALSRYVNLDSWSRQQRKELETSLAAFSDYLVDNFFLPRMLYIPYVT
jgi:lipopolysaccharide export LptBFGC system permease protein LptF